MNEIRARDLYLNLLKDSLRNTLYETPPLEPSPMDLRHMDQLIERVNFKFRKFGPRVLDTTAEELYPRVQRNRGANSYTLVDENSLENLRRCILSVLRNKIPGDLMEAGVYRGGLTIFMRGMLNAIGIKDRKVHVADSFEGLPAPDPNKSVGDAVSFELLKEVGSFRTSLEEVRASFAKFGLLDDQVNFIKGWFAETLPTCNVEKLAVLRLDADWYESTKVALEALYPKISSGGFIIIDDYGLPLGAKPAVDEYRKAHGITAPIYMVNDQEGFWKKP